MKLALAQINTTVGDLRGNANKVSDYCRKARDAGASLVVFPELTLTGYPPLDLLESEDFVAREQKTRKGLAQTLPANLGVLLGGLARNPGHGKPLHNAAYLYENGDCAGVCHKQLLPDYDVFDERRHFAPGADPTVLRWRGHKLGVHICEDLWNVRESSRRSYTHDPIATLAGQTPDLFINLCASPFAIDKHLDRYSLMETVWQRYRRPYVFTNLVGANTGLIFDGRSCVIQGGQVLEAAPFEETLLMWGSSLPSGSEPVSASPTQQVLEALKLGILDYVEKTGVFEQVFVGLSGGIDSAVTAALAAQALGPKRVVGVAMPSAYSSSGSLDDASQLASNLGIELHTIPIHEVIAAFNNALKGQFSGLGAGVAEENIQARTRGTLLMAFANKFNGMVLATGNKSELATGYATLYGDMSGGLAVLGDLYKTEVYELARLLNASDELIPESSITKPPSAELRPNQVDQDSLPPYEALDEILKAYIEGRLSVDEIVSRTGYERTLIESITLMVDRTEYKRKQAAPVLRLRRKAFGSGRKEPIVARRT
ncbi:MAG: NAD+ synthase [Rhodothermaceae bacterium]|nr:NAD+ synthase [Rhodothermaceae bacterium]MXX57932.1 NAD+ synthase [Rhodothermaceae bacterium]MYD19991.1 NAD+ synthase [Rhodothermaceae bacterium]MYD56144.1 NAD+ synthase [Rhodothermaceae bacterium]MYI43886.1 NAD+ synthase [Rhodothermaceae bacterium]